MTIEQEHRKVGLVFYWMLIAKSLTGEVLAWVMDVDYNRGIIALNEALTEL